MDWYSPHEDSIKISGLPWTRDNAPDLWRLPRADIDSVSWQVSPLARYAAGAAVRLATDSTAVSLRASAISEPTGEGVDVYVDGSFWRTVTVKNAGETDICCFDGCDRSYRKIDLKTPATVSVRLYDLLGQEVAELVQGAHPVGVTTISWDGKIGSGRQAASGVYLVDIRIGSQKSVRRMAWIR